MSKKKFPKTLYVKRENPDSGDEYMSTSEDFATLAESNDSVAVGVYELKCVRTIVNKSELSDAE